MEADILGKLIDNQSNGFIILNKEFIVLYANKRVREFFQSNTNELLGNYIKCNYTILEKVNCQNTSNCNKCIINNKIRMVREKNIVQNLDNFKFNSNGKYINISLRISYIDDFIILEFVDLSELHKEVNFLSRMMDKTKDIMFFKDSDLKYRYVNKSCADFFNKKKHELLNKDDKELLKDNLLDKYLYKNLRVGDLDTLRKGYYSEVLMFRDKYLHVLKEKIDGGILCIARDITSEIQANKRAETDFLTNLYNRRKFINTIDEILKNKKNDYYLALIDIDDLKKINDDCGHLIGDKYLSSLGDILNNYNEGIFFRIGGDEFAGLIQGDINTVSSTFKNIFDDLKKINFEPSLSISVGIKKININKSYIENYNEVDYLLYKAKERGKNKIIIG